MATFRLVLPGTTRLGRKGDTALVEVVKEGDQQFDTERLSLYVDGTEMLRVQALRSGMSLHVNEEYADEVVCEKVEFEPSP